MDQQNADSYLTAEQVAEYIGFSVGTIYNKVSAGEFPCHKFGAKTVRFKKSEVDAWLNEQEEKMKQRKITPDAAEPEIPRDILDILKIHPVEAPAFLRKKFGK
jgi:excisionase family DNA binding protein